MIERASRWNTVWITGASSGIGRALAFDLAAKGRMLIISGRSTDKLEDIGALCRERGSDVEIIPFDISVESDRNDAIAHLRSRGIVPDLLINNAGVSQRDQALRTEYTIDRVITETNYLGSVHLTKAVLPEMMKRNNGLIAVVSSIAGLLPSRLRSAYNGAKAAQIAYFRTLRNEIRTSGVAISIVVPGFVRTDVSESALKGDGSQHGQRDRNQAKGISPQQAAREIRKGLERKRSTIYTGVPFGVRRFIAFGRIAPGIVDRVLSRMDVE